MITFLSLCSSRSSSRGVSITNHGVTFVSSPSITTQERWRSCWCPLVNLWAFPSVDTISSMHVTEYVVLRFDEGYVVKKYGVSHHPHRFSIHNTQGGAVCNENIDITWDTTPQIAEIGLSPIEAPSIITASSKWQPKKRKEKNEVENIINEYRWWNFLFTLKRNSNEFTLYLNESTSPIIIGVNKKNTTNKPRCAKNWNLFSGVSSNNIRRCLNSV